MRRILAALTVTAGLLAMAPAAEAHTYDAAKAACDWVEVRTWGPNPNGVTRLRNSPVHLWGSHQADCRYGDVGPTNYNVCVLVDLISGWEHWTSPCVW